MPAAITLEDRRLDVASWLPAREWAGMPAEVRKRLVDRACEIARREKLVQLANGIGADGRRLPKRKAVRKDRATGTVLSPHRSESRSQKWVRAVPGYKAGTVTITWASSWLSVLGYHAEGRVRGAPVRNVLMFHPAAIRRIKMEVQSFWTTLLRTYGWRMRFPAPPAPPRQPPAAPSLPFPPFRRVTPIRAPAARPQVQARPS